MQRAGQVAVAFAIADDLREEKRLPHLKRRPKPARENHEMILFRSNADETASAAGEAKRAPSRPELLRDAHDLSPT